MRADRPARAPIVFDLDGTLIDSLPGIAAAANALLADNGLAALPVEQVAGFVGLGERVFLDRLIAATALDPRAYDDLLARFLELYIVQSRNTALFPHVADVLEALGADGVPLGLCTNKPSGPLRAVMEAAGLADIFGVVVAGDTLAVRKPDPEPLRHAFAALGESGLFVGDSPVDAETAERAGVPFALFTEGIRDVPLAQIPHAAAFADMRDLPDIYAALTGVCPRSRAQQRRRFSQSSALRSFSR